MVVGKGSPVARTAVSSVAGKSLLCGLFLLCVVLIGIPAYADDATDASNMISLLYSEYGGITGMASGGLQSGYSTDGNPYYAQWFSSGLALLAWSDGYMYFLNGSTAVPLGVIWKTSLVLATAMIQAVYATNPTFYGTPTGNIQMGTDAGGSYYVLAFVNGTGIYAASSGTMYYAYSGMWYPLGVNWK
ncbi:hypothetical protein [Candidatus Magnetominusculus dajiuhuensis]|uniref:hypothetical protein n=1 Tax=Candidatus Magnetominusculus dajiuhuensis TaxID=3137712 RepID=UPI003B42A51E